MSHLTFNEFIHNIFSLLWKFFYTTKQQKFLCILSILTFAENGFCVFGTNFHSPFPFKVFFPSWSRTIFVISQVRAGFHFGNKFQFDIDFHSVPYFLIMPFGLMRIVNLWMENSLMQLTNRVLLFFAQFFFKDESI